MSGPTRADLLLKVKKCDARGCGSPAEITDRLGARFCRGHAYLAYQPAAEVKP